MKIRHRRPLPAAVAALVDGFSRLGLTGGEVYEIRGLATLGSGEVPERLTVRADDTEFSVHPRIDTTHGAAY